MLEMCQNELQRSRNTDDRRCVLSSVRYFQFTPHAKKRVKYNKVYSLAYTVGSRLTWPYIVQILVERSGGGGLGDGGVAVWSTKVKKQFLLVFAFSFSRPPPFQSLQSLSCLNALSLYVPLSVLPLNLRKSLYGKILSLSTSRQLGFLDSVIANKNT